MRRYGLRDDQWDRIKDFLPGREGLVGGTATDNRLFVEAVLYRFRAAGAFVGSCLRRNGRAGHAACVPIAVSQWYHRYHRTSELVPMIAS